MKTYVHGFEGSILLKMSFLLKFICRFDVVLIKIPICCFKNRSWQTIFHESESHSQVSDSLWPYGLQPARLLCPWDSLGKKTSYQNPKIPEQSMHFFFFRMFKFIWLYQASVAARRIFSCSMWDLVPHKGSHQGHLHWEREF